MRFHIFKDSPSKSLLIADSQAKRLDFSNINAGGNDLYNGYLPSTESVDDVTERLVKLANELLNVSERVFVLGIPARYTPESERELVEDHELVRHFAVNRKLEKSAEARWVFRGLSDQIYCEN